MNEETKQLKSRVDELERLFKLLSSSTTIPYDVGEAFKKRLQVVGGDSNATLASTETQAVNEAGAGTYNVAKPMDGFITIVVNGNSRKVPYYT